MKKILGLLTWFACALAAPASAFALRDVELKDFKFSEKCAELDLVLKGNPGLVMKGSDPALANCSQASAELCEDSRVLLEKNPQNTGKLICRGKRLAQSHFASRLCFDHPELGSSFVWVSATSASSLNRAVDGSRAHLSGQRATNIRACN